MNMTDNARHHDQRQGKRSRHLLAFPLKSLRSTEAEPNARFPP
jgi:hypothetical protein